VEKSHAGKNCVLKNVEFKSAEHSLASKILPVNFAKRGIVKRVNPIKLENHKLWN
jgi:hypothetical protein